MSEEILYHKQLQYKENPVPFVIKNTAEMNEIAGIPHKHSYFAVVWSFNSSGKHLIDFKEFAFEPNSIFIVNPGQVHQIISDPKPEGYLILFTPEFLAGSKYSGSIIQRLKFLSQPDNSLPLTATKETADMLKNFADGMMDAFHSGNNLRYETIEAYLKLFLIKCDEHFFNLNNNDKSGAIAGNPVAESFKIMVNNSFNKYHKVKDYAQELNITPNYLSEVIKSSTGQSPKEYIQARVLTEAKRMILFTDRSIKEIGYDLGFEDPSQFSRFFKDSTGLNFKEFKDSFLLIP